MAATVRLTVMTGPHKSERFCFCGPTCCLVGRGEDCFVQMAGAPKDGLISRHHCQLLIDPPILKVLDLGSLNGTYINGRMVESVEMTLPAAEKELLPPNQTAQAGDCLTIGGTTFKVDLVDCPHLEQGLDDKPAWDDGAIAKKHCPLTCYE